MNGALAQADIFGIFAAKAGPGTRWTTPTAVTPAYLAMKFSEIMTGRITVSATRAFPPPARIRTGYPPLPRCGRATGADGHGVQQTGDDQCGGWRSASRIFRTSGRRSVAVEATSPADQTVASITHLSDISFSKVAFNEHGAVE